MPIQVTSDFPGGNSIIEKQEGNTFFLRQDYSTSDRWWFWWYFRAEGMPGETARFTFTDGDVFTSMGPCVRVGEGAWEWLSLDVVCDNGFSYTFPDVGAATTTVLFALSIPYVEEDLHAFLAKHPDITSHVLTHTRKGRAVEHIVRLSEKGTYSIFLTARHHACECTANYVLEGALAFPERDDPKALFIREHVDLHAVPFVDKDGVMDGEQGKGRIPHDHNRDYIEFLYPETKAVAALPKTFRGKLHFTDIHCPWIRGGRNEEIFFGASGSCVDFFRKKGILTP